MTDKLVGEITLILVIMIFLVLLSISSSLPVDPVVVPTPWQCPIPTQGPWMV